MSVVLIVAGCDCFEFGDLVDSASPDCDLHVALMLEETWVTLAVVITSVGCRMHLLPYGERPLIRNVRGPSI